MKINSVLGPIETADLGKTLIHEHVVCFSAFMYQAFGEKWLKINELTDLAVAMYDKATDEYGIKTIVDGTPINNGRNIKILLEVAKRCKMNIIASTGFYYCDDPFLIDKPVEQLTEIFLDECKNGISGTSVLPGIIKCGVGTGGFTSTSELLLKLTGILQKETGLPVFAHSEALERAGIGEQDRLEKYGADLTRVVIGHSGDSNDLDYLEKLLKRGSYIGMDRFGECNNINSLENRVDTIVKLAERGWLHRMLLSHDHSVYFDWGYRNWNDFIKEDNVDREYDFTFVHRRAIPLLIERGMSQKEIDSMLIGNIRNLFEGK